MLTIFRRHLKQCKFTSRDERSCQCPISVEGVLNGKLIRRSLGLRSWEAAQKEVRNLEVNGDREIVTLKTAGERFISARKAKGNTEETIKKLERLTKNLDDFFGEIPIETVTVDDVARFYESWKLSPITKGKQLERMRSFFNFSMRRKWIADNPCLGIERPVIHEIERKPFEPEEMEKIIWSIPLFPMFRDMAGC